MITYARIAEIAREEANNVAAPGLPDGARHNQRTIAHAIRRALIEAGALTPKEPEPTPPPHTCSYREDSTVCEICGS